MTAMPTSFPAAAGDEFAIEFAVDQERNRIAACWTVGLSTFGFPELVIIHEEDDDDLLDDFDDEDDDEEDDWEAEPQEQHALRSAQILALLGQDVLAAGSTDLPPRCEPVNGLLVRFWLGDPQRPDPRVALALPRSETVVPVHWVIA
jgi:hypothetical protein